MLFRRRVDESAQWVAVAHNGGVLHAAQVRHIAGQRPCLRWLWRTTVSDTSEGLRALRKAHSLRACKLTGLFDRSQYRLMTTEVPELPREEWRDAMRWRLKEQVDFPMDDALLDILAVPQETQLKKTQPAIAVVAQRLDYKRWELAADDMGLRWRAMDVPEMAMRNLSAMAELPDQAHALIAFGDTYGLLVITYRGELLMTRHIEVALTAITGSPEERGAALGRAALEVLRTLDSFERMHSEAVLSGLSVVSPDSSGEVLEVLADLVYLPVKKLELDALIDMSALGADAQRLANNPTLDELCVVGSALRSYIQERGFQQLQLIDARHVPAAKLPWSARWGVRLSAAVGGGACAAALGMTLITARWQQQTSELKLQTAQLRQSATALGVPAEFKELGNLKETETRQRQLRDALQSAAPALAAPYSEYLTALARQTQTGLWITGLSVRVQGSDLMLTGRMVDPAQLPIYLGRLEQEPQFKGRRFAQIEMRSLDLKDGNGEAASTLAGRVIEFTLRGQPSKGEAGAASQGEPSS